MAITYNVDGTVLVTPQAVAKYTVEPSTSGLTTSGGLMLIGEADAGPHFTNDLPLADNVVFGPDQGAAVVAKFRSGPLVDAYNVAVAPSNDPNIVGAPFRIVLVKTNNSTQAKAALLQNGGAYAEVADLGWGRNGNGTFLSVEEARTEVAPTTNAFTWIPRVATSDLSVRVDGGTASTVSIPANSTPAAVQGLLDAATGIEAVGAIQKTLLAAGTVGLTAISGSNRVTVTLSGSTVDSIAPGDTLVIPPGSVLEGANEENVGAYMVTSATASTITAAKLSDAGAAGAAEGTVTQPVSVSPVALSGVPDDDIAVWGTIVVNSDPSAVIQGVGKTLEIALSTGSAGVYAPGTESVANWLSRAGTPRVITATEQMVAVNVNRISDGVSEQHVVGGDVGLRIGYVGTAASVTVTGGQLLTTVTGGVGTNLTLNFVDFKNLGELVSRINNQPGYTASVGASSYSALPCAALDRVTADIASAHGGMTGRIKLDAHKFVERLSESVTVQPVDRGAAGLPSVTTQAVYLSGGTRGATTDADVAAALTKLEGVDGNFVIPLFSRDSALDVSAGLTDPASNYSIEAIAMQVRTHALKCSGLKVGRPRQGFIGVQASVADSAALAANLGTNRMGAPFQDFRAVGSNGSIAQLQPWASAVNAAAMTAVGEYQSIVAKFINTAGAVHAEFDPTNQTEVENALLAGLLPMAPSPDGGWKWVSDQTTYGRDDNFVYNSIQVTYVADLMAMDLRNSFNRAFVGKSQADVTVSLALSFLKTKMDQYRARKWIAPSDDAVAGWKNPKINIKGPVMTVRFEAKVAGSIYFIPIAFNISQVTQSS